MLTGLHFDHWNEITGKYDCLFFCHQLSYEQRQKYPGKVLVLLWEHRNLLNTQFLIKEKYANWSGFIYPESLLYFVLILARKSPFAEIGQVTQITMVQNRFPGIKVTEQFLWESFVNETPVRIGHLWLYIRNGTTFLHPIQQVWSQSLQV